MIAEDAGTAGAESRRQRIQERRSGTRETAIGGSVGSRLFIVIAIAIACLAFSPAGTAYAQAEWDATEIPVPAQAPVIPDLPSRNPLVGSKTTEVKTPIEGEAEFAEEDEDAETGEELAAEDEDEASVDTETAGIPPLPTRRTPPELVARKYEEPIGPPAQPQVWSKEEIAEARAECDTLLAGITLQFEALEPMREGVCGTPAPLLVESVTAGQTVTIRPSARLTCGMTSQFHRWLEDYVQPSAKTHLDTEITGVLNVASYHCRTRYDDPGQRMSQHAFANALDIAGFITAKGGQISVEKSWPANTPESLFLKEVHAGACKLFGTVLGPDANAAHSNHFHLDMTKRRRGYCR